MTLTLPPHKRQQPRYPNGVDTAIIEALLLLLLLLLLQSFSPAPCAHLLMVQGGHPTTVHGT